MKTPILVPDPLPSGSIVIALTASPVAADVRSLARTIPSIEHVMFNLDTYLSALWPGHSGHPSLAVQAIEDAVAAHHTASCSSEGAIFMSRLIVVLASALRGQSALIQTRSLPLRWDVLSAQSFRETLISSHAKSFEVTPVAGDGPSLPLVYERLAARLLTPASRECLERLGIAPWAQSDKA